MQRGWFLFGVFLVSGSVLMVQLLLSRIFSVTTWYHVSFLVISIAMFGMTLGAVKVYRGDAETQRKTLSYLAAKGSLYFGISLPVAAMVSMMVPIVDSHVARTAIFLPTVAILTSVPFYFAGMVISLCLTRSPFKVSTVYGYDLLGAAAGCLVALMLMETVDTPSALLIVSAIPVASGLCFRRAATGGAADQPLFDGKPLVTGVVLLLIFGSVNAMMEKPVVYPRYSKGVLIPLSSIELDRWNSISRVTVLSERKDDIPFTWGPSTRLPESARATYRQLIIDGNAATPLTRFEGTRFENVDFLSYDITSLAYRLSGLEKAAVIGVGGGRDVLTAKYFGVDSVVALDVNAIQIDLLRDDPYYRNYTGFDRLENVELVHSEARSWFSRNRESFDIIQMSLVDTWAATGAGAYALSENGLYTVEAWRVFLDDLSDGGVFTVSRWMSKSEMVETGRILSLAVATLLDRGATDPAAHIFLATTKLDDKNISNLVVAKNPLSAEQIDALHAVAAELDFNIVASPRQSPVDPLVRGIVGAQDADGLERATRHSSLNLFAPTDTRPFFFNQAPLDQPLELIRMVRNEKFHGLSGQARASLNLLIVIVASLLMVVLVILLPLIRTLHSVDRVTFTGGTLYFFLIGTGFMFIEISLLQTMGLYLGHPNLSLAVVLFSLILSTGIGSLLSGRIPLDRNGALAGWAVLTTAYFLVMGLSIHWIFFELTELTLVLRALTCLALTIPGGILLGFGFPTGMALCQQRNSRIMPWLWGINGAAGVLGSAVAIAANIMFGLDKTMMLGALCYLLLLPPALLLKRPARGPETDAALQSSPAE